jgi:hypothetical protein
MASEDLNLTGIKTLDQTLARTRNGAAAVELAKRLGIWTTEAHANPRLRPRFPEALSELTPAQLSDLYGHWTGEFGRILELLGAVSAQESLLRIQLKGAQAAARARIRRAQPADAKPLAIAALNDQADEDPVVLDLVEQTALLAVLSAHASAARDATTQYLSTISREIAFRDAQLKARVY